MLWSQYSVTNINFMNLLWLKPEVDSKKNYGFRTFKEKLQLRLKLD